jgi:hypothetical protein
LTNVKELHQKRFQNFLFLEQATSFNAGNIIQNAIEQRNKKISIEDGWLTKTGRSNEKRKNDI